MRLSCLLPFCLAIVATSHAADYSCRWVYVSRGLHKDQDVEDIRGIVNTAAQHGLNGMVLAAGLDRLDRQPARYLERLESVKQLCADRHIEIIPIVFSAGYGGSVLAYDRNLAEGLLVRDAPFLVRGAEARLERESTATIVNGGFEDHVGDRASGCRFHDQPGKVTFVDTTVAKEGRASLRFENFGQYPHGHGRVVSEPKLYEIWQRQTELIQQHLAPRRWLLSMDEIRAGGSCEACRSRQLSMAEILGDCLKSQYQMIRRANPKAEVFVWSDMLDPNHNARANYYLVEGDYTWSWKHVPKDLRIVCWYFEKRRESLAHFSGLGFQTLAGAYYDGDTLDNPKGWLESLDKTPGALGIMYTTWQNKYALLAPFGGLVSRNSPQ